ncbi:MAG: alpha/beta hydrolase [Ruminococcaceae bacterium]|nr:alpha/beta hydrolase [Oscillospiraceae bacterium]
MKTAVVYVHGKGGSPSEAERFRPLFPNCAVIGFDYYSESPWDAKIEFSPFFNSLKEKYDSVVLIANSIGAYFSMTALSAKQVDRAFFISPIVDMQKLIEDMMGWAGVTKESLQARGIIPTSFGETLSWKYYTYVCAHKAGWSVPTEILYGENDNLTAHKTIETFATRFRAGLTIMENGEHWFHTAEQLRFMDNWLKQKAEKEK